MKYFKLPLDNLNKAADDIKTVPGATPADIKEYQDHIAAAKKVVVRIAVEAGWKADDVMKEPVKEAKKSLKHLLDGI